MRFENLEFREQICFLRRLHKQLNKDLFDGQLKQISIDIENLNGHRTKEKAFAEYLTETVPGIIPRKISFDHDFIDYISQLKTQKEQGRLITQVLLHEMIHQYCAENGINDENHSDAWQQAAAEHGLHSIYKNGEFQEEWALPVAHIATINLRIR